MMGITDDKVNPRRVCRTCGRYQTHMEAILTGEVRGRALSSVRDATERGVFRRLREGGDYAQQPSEPENPRMLIVVAPAMREDLRRSAHLFRRESQAAGMTLHDREPPRCYLLVTAVHGPRSRIK